MVILLSKKSFMIHCSMICLYLFLQNGSDILSRFVLRVLFRAGSVVCCLLTTCQLLVFVMDCDTQCWFLSEIGFWGSRIQFLLWLVTLLSVMDHGCHLHTVKEDTLVFNPSVTAVRISISVNALLLKNNTSSQNTLQIH